ncbi:ATP-binding protein [Streptomyces sp. NPDC000151]|uniref:sensor histidine kinase n=1 Tax=Streptomyces sp. NPDC000151 TaxID=3154244 RepID=UPI0033343418
MSGDVRPETAPFAAGDFARMLAALPLCVLVHDAADQRILWANPAACDVLGFTVDELRPLKAPDMSANARQYAREIGVSWLRRAAAEGTSTIEWRYRSKDGTEILTEAVATRVDLAAGPVVTVQFRDIGDQVRAAEEHRRDLQYLNHLARYNAMGDMAMAIAHEVSQPIAAAHNFVAGARSRLGDDAAPAHLVFGLDHATRQLDRAADILSSLRRYVTRLEQSAQRVDLRDIVADCGYFIETRAKEAGVPIAWQPAREPLPVRCEEVLIGQVVMNLAFNAVEALAGLPGAAGAVTLRTRRHGGLAELAVLDTGPGLPPIPPEQIFDGAFSAKRDGHGIGLALSHRIAARHGGTLTAAPHHPRGAAFTLRLPLDPVPRDGASA